MLVLYSPFKESGVPLSPGNAAFDAKLRGKDSSWGLREVEWIAQLATARSCPTPLCCLGRGSLAISPLLFALRLL